VNLLLDTHAFLWYSAADSQLSSHARSLIEDEDNERLLSVASLIEMAIKHSLGRLGLKDPFDQFVADGLAMLKCGALDLTVPQAAKLSILPFHHRDPFDRIMVAQALVDDIDVVSADKTLDAYGIRRHW
jgi:PIN domain nuclease of toxin-antitoxin system